MLSGETAVGKYPLQAVETMVRIALIAEQYLREHKELHHDELNLQTLRRERQRSVPAAISHVTSQIADMLEAKLIVASTWSVTHQQLALVWGVMPVLVEEFETIDQMIDVVVRTARESDLVEDDDLMVIIGGVPFGQGSQTNFLKVLMVGERDAMS